MTNIVNESDTDIVYPHLSELEHERIFAYFRQIANMVGTPRWVLRLATDPSDEGTCAQIRMNEDRYFATLKVCADWMDLPTSEKQNTIIHEVCHLLFHRLDHVVDDVVNLMHDHEYEKVRDAYSREVELIVDQLSVTLQDHAPAWPAA